MAFHQEHALFAAFNNHSDARKRQHENGVQMIDSGESRAKKDRRDGSNQMMIGHQMMDVDPPVVEQPIQFRLPAFQPQFIANPQRPLETIVRIDRRG